MIDMSNWKEFRIGDYFEIFHGVRLTKSKRKEGDIPLLTAGYENQGVAEYISNPEMPRYKNPITVDMFGNCFYHDGIYTGDDNIYFFINDDISHHAKIFLSTMIMSVLQGHYDYGRQFRQGDADTLKVILPTTLFDEPDWQYMESYMKKVMEESEEYIRIMGGHSVEKHPIDIGEWGEFHLYDLFDISMGNKMDRGKMSDGDIAFVGRTAKENGINARVAYVENHEKYGTVEPYNAGCLTLALGGSIGSCFYQKEPFYTSQNVAVLIPRNNENELALLFISSVISFSVLYGKYEAFIEELNKHIKTDFTIMLPVTPSGEPDWQYMEEYMKEIMEEQEKNIEKLAKKGID